MSTVTQFKAAKPPAGDPLRATLAEAIEGQCRAEANAAGHDQAVGRARDLVGDAEAALERARSGVAKAKTRHAENIASAAASGAPPSRQGAVREARAHERDAEDDLEAARDALAQIEAGRADVGDAAAVAAADVVAKVNEVVSAEAEHLLAEMGAARSRCLALAQAIAALTLGDDDLPKIDDTVARLRAHEAAEAPLKNVRRAAEPLLHNGPAITDEAERSAMAQVGGAWRAWRRALRTDPHASPPEAP